MQMGMCEYVWMYSYYLHIAWMFVCVLTSLPVLHNTQAVKLGVHVCVCMWGTILIADLFSMRYFQLKRQLQESLINNTFCANLVIYKIP